MKKQARYFSTEIKQIDLDVNRTFRNHIMFMDRFGVKSVSPHLHIFIFHPGLPRSTSHDSLSE